MNLNAAGLSGILQVTRTGACILTALLVFCGTPLSAQEVNPIPVPTTGTLVAAEGEWEFTNRQMIDRLRQQPLSTEQTSQALAFFAEAGDDRAVEPILDLITRAESSMRRNAIDTLARMRGRAVTRRLWELLPAMESDLQETLSATLARSHDPASVPPLVVTEWLTTRSLVTSAPPSSGPLLRFSRTRLNSRAFEAAAIADINMDGHPDIVSGAFWYPGPGFTQSHRIVQIEPSGEYYDDFSSYPMDINGDGYPDLVTGGYFGGPLRWRENPAGRPEEWKEHPIAQIGSIETTRFWDVDGDGHVEICPNAAWSAAFRLERDEAGRPTGKFTRHEIRKEGIGHGLGFGDINGDGRGDFVGPDGWYEAPEKSLDGELWKLHRDFSLGTVSVPILVYDVNKDGLNDLIVGQGHGYGFEWVEQTRSPEGDRGWIRHWIDPDRSQFHEMFLADLDNDGEPEVITGKRWRAHNGADPGADEPVGLYYYKINGGQFERFTLNYGPSDRNSGTGIYLWAEDIDGDGWKDIIAPGKEGLYLFRNQGIKP